MVIFRPLTQNFGQSGRAGRKWFTYSYSAGKKAIKMMKSSSWDLKKASKMQASVICPSLMRQKFCAIEWSFCKCYSLPLFSGVNVS